MKRTYTENDVLLFIYNEMPPEECLGFKEELRGNKELMNFYQNTIQTMGMLDKISFEPHPTSVNILLEYSSHDHLETH